MISIRSAALATVALMLGVGTASAQQTCPPGTLGVARVVEIDTTKDKRFGEPFGNPEFLAKGEVVLTFDDGPVAKNTRPILEALAAQCTKATFFSVGEMALEFPEVVKEIVAQGHTIGGHTWSHVNIRRQTDERARMQIEAAFTAIEKAAGGPIAPFFRFPYLSESDSAIAHLAKRNIAIFAIDVDSFDWRNRNADAVVRRIMAGLEHRGRGIVLMHDIHASTAKAVPALLAQLKAKGYKIVHMIPAKPLQTLAEYQPPEKPSARAHEHHGREPVRRRVRRSPGTAAMLAQ